MVSSLDLQALQIFLQGPISHDMIHKLVVATLQVIPCKDTKSSTYTTTNNTIKQLPSLMTFLTKLIKYTNVYTGTLLATLIYLQKLKIKLPKNVQGLACTRHRILLTCLILSSKFHNDSSPKNKHWAKYTDGLFNVKDINLMERQLIYLLNWDLKVSNEEMCIAYQSFLEPIKLELIKQEKLKRYKQQQQQQQTKERLSLSPLQLHYRQNSSSSINSVNSSTTVESQYSNSEISHSTSSSSIASTTSNSSHTSPLQVKVPKNYDLVDPIIELTALKEEMELKNLLKQLNNSNSSTTINYNAAPPAY
ncbi:unnamed protein product [Candida verbasci]|uniref:Cyclin N-terminal domain-containing protein n=1 Tax=Candida verbasci TaxID=1227364 RepID=A0A9W4U0P5_9ASCO|nr:unnamed protein product [Candida verbasci]